MAGNDLQFEQAWELVRRTVLGYEYPEGLELLASVHYLASRSEQLDPAAVARQLADWSERKRRIFRPEDAEAACDHLVRTNMLAPTPPR